MSEDIRKELYRQLKGAEVYNGDYASFTADIDKPKVREELYNQLSKAEVYNGTYEQFDKDLTGDKKRYSVPLKNGEKKYFDTKEEGDAWCVKYIGFLRSNEVPEPISEDLLARFTDEQIAYDKYLKEKATLEVKMNKQFISLMEEKIRKRKELEEKYNIGADGSATEEIAEIYKERRKEQIQGYAIDCTILATFAIITYIIYKNVKAEKFFFERLRRHIIKKICYLDYDIKHIFTELKERIMTNGKKSIIFGAIICIVLAFVYWQYGDKRFMSDDDMVYYEYVNSRNILLHTNISCSKAHSIAGGLCEFGECIPQYPLKYCTHCFWSWDIKKIIERGIERNKKNMEKK